MLERRKLRLLFCIIIVLLLSGVIWLGYFCPDRICALSAGSTSQLQQPYMDEVSSYLRGGDYNVNSFKHDVVRKMHSFDFDGDDVFVFLHIQKTGGTTFGRHLVKNLSVKRPCDCGGRRANRKRCLCLNNKNKFWIFSRYSTGWQCGLHADWTELKDCVYHQLDKIEGIPRFRRYLYITILRDPVARFLSEWKHVERGATWKATRLKCNGRRATIEEVPFCYKGTNWEDVTLDEFMSCPHNLANDRQVRMMANLSRVGCYNKTIMSEKERDAVLIDSAKENLRNLAFFGLTEHQIYTQYLFERTFDLAFNEDFIQMNITHSDLVNLTQSQKDTILKLNDLDIQLYQYAKDLFFQRLHKTLLNDSAALRQLSQQGIPEAEVNLIALDKLLSLLNFEELTAGSTPNEETRLELQRKMERKVKRKKYMENSGWQVKPRLSGDSSRKSLGKTDNDLDDDSWIKSLTNLQSSIKALVNTSK